MKKPIFSGYVVVIKGCGVALNTLAKTRSDCNAKGVMSLPTKYWNDSDVTPIQIFKASRKVVDRIGSLYE